MSNRILPLVSAAVLLSGCGVKAVPPTVPPGGVAAFDTAYTNVLALAPTNPMPAAGSANYAGQFHGTLSGGSGGGDILGDLGLSANFAANTISGSLTSIDVFGNSTVANQTLGGSVGLNGTIAGNGMTASGAGNLSLVKGNQQRNATSAADLTGTFRGAGAAAVAGTMTFDLHDLFGLAVTPFGNGRFYAQ